MQQVIFLLSSSYVSSFPTSGDSYVATMSRAVIACVDTRDSIIHISSSILDLAYPMTTQLRAVSTRASGCEGSVSCYFSACGMVLIFGPIWFSSTIGFS